MNYTYYAEYKVKVGKRVMIIRFMGKELEKLFKYYNIPYEIIARKRFDVK